MIPKKLLTRPLSTRSLWASACTAFVFLSHGIVMAQVEPAASAENKAPIYGTITEDSPSIAEYFSWINNTNEGATEAHTITNLEFFKWLRDEYGMQLGIYAWDAGNIDSARYYGSMETEKFKRQFPNGWAPIADVARSFDCKMGLWAGPDGFGDTPEEEKERTEFLVSLCRDFELQLFKFDAVATQLREEKQDAFANAMIQCRKYAPDLVVLNHRLKLGDAKPHATTFLWGGRETYIDVHFKNTTTAIHNRAGAMSRGLPPELKRLTEDHGVCISSCLDHWEDDLILQAFNRNLILAPQIYGNPWLLRDDEFAKLARVFNLHRRCREILVKGMVLPEDKYGIHAVARGDETTRYITMRNLTWEPVTYTVKLDEEIGLKLNDNAGTESAIEVRRYHPSERILGSFKYGDTVEVEVPPFRSYLLMASAQAVPEIGITGCDYEVVRDTPGKPALVKLLGLPASTAEISLKPGGRTFTKASIDGESQPEILEGEFSVSFAGEPIALPAHRKMADMKKVPVSADAEQLYEATCFAGSNNALETQSAKRSGATTIPAVKKARDAFFNQELFWRRGISDEYMYDGKLETFFSVYHYDRDKRIAGGALRVDFGRAESVDTISLQSLCPADSTEKPAGIIKAQVSADLKTWQDVRFERGEVSGDKVQVARIRKNGGTSELYDADVYSFSADFSRTQQVRFLRVFEAPGRIAELSASGQGQKLPADLWHATHLFAPYWALKPAAAWEAEFEIPSSAAPGSYLCVAVEGKHGMNQAFAGLRVEGQYVGASGRAPSYPCAAWEYPVSRHDKNNTFFFPVTEQLRGKTVQAVVLAFDDKNTDLQPHIWITTGHAPRQSVMVQLEE